jgi:hypothetical protein
MIRIIAYTYEADAHCIGCTQKRFSDTGKVYGNENDIATFKSATDENGIWFEAEDSEGNFVHPLFDIDEWMELDAGHVEENPTQYLACGNCHEIIDTYEHIKDGVLS